MFHMLTPVFVSTAVALSSSQIQTNHIHHLEHLKHVEQSQHHLLIESQKLAPVKNAVEHHSSNTNSMSTIQDGVDWQKLAMCESTGNWHINTGNNFYGGLQFSETTWLSYGGGQYNQYANDATPSEQISVAVKVLAAQGPKAWPKSYSRGSVCGF